MYRAIRGGPVIVAGVSRELAEGELLDDLNPGDIELLTAHGWIEEARRRKAQARERRGQAASVGDTHHRQG